MVTLITLAKQLLVDKEELLVFLSVNKLVPEIVVSETDVIIPQTVVDNIRHVMTLGDNSSNVTSSNSPSDEECDIEF